MLQTISIVNFKFSVITADALQGALDLRYLSAREAKGKQYIQDLMGRSQVYRQVASGLTDFASELLRYQMDTGARPDAFLEALG